MEWVLPGEERSVRQSRKIDDKKIMFVLFFTSEKVLIANFVPTGQTIDAEFFCNLIRRHINMLPVRMGAVGCCI